MSDIPRAGYPPDGTPPAAVFVDLDGTLISRSSEKLFLRHLLAEGLVTLPSFLRFLALYAVHPVRSAQEGKGWNRSYLRGLPEEEFREKAGAFGRGTLSGFLHQWTVNAVSDLAGKGWRAVLMTASLEPLASAVADGMPFSEVVASRPAAVDGTLTGDLAGPRPWGMAKADLVREYCRGHGMDPSDCMAIGDSWSDMSVMLLCGRGVAVSPDRRLRRLAAAEGWSIVDGKPVRWE